MTEMTDLEVFIKQTRELCDAATEGMEQKVSRQFVT